MNKLGNVSKMWEDTTKALLFKMDEFINEYKVSSEDYLNYRDSSKMITMLDKIIRARKEFDAVLFFMVICGPLKSGKSTLTNILAREYVSPIELGQECTLRPSIIIQSRSPLIEEFFPVNIEEDQEKLFHLVVDYLRGIVEEQEIDKKIRRVSSALNRENLNKKLTVEAEGETPLITVIHVSGGNMLKNGVAILDMPGFDGLKAYNDAQKHKWVMERADFIIFVQSSVAAISKNTFDFLNNLDKATRRPPFWLVHNMLKAKFWRTEDEQLKELREQRDKAKRQIIEGLHLQDLQSDDINLGIAWDGVHLHNDEWYKESKFDEFETKMLEVLQKGRVRMQEGVCINGVEKSLEEVGTIAKELKETLKCYLDKYNEIDDVFQDGKKVFLDISYDKGYKFNAFAKGIEELIRVAIEQRKPEIMGKITGKKLNALIESYVDEVAAALESKYNVFREFGFKVQSMAQEHIENVEDEILKKIECKFVEEHNILIRLSRAYSFNSLPSFGKMTFKWEKAQQRGFLGLNKMYEEREVNGELGIVVGGMERQLSEHKKKWEVAFFEAFSKHITERKSFLIDQLEEKRQEYKKIKEKELAMIQNTIDYMDKFIKSLNELASTTAEAKSFVLRL